MKLIIKLIAFVLFFGFIYAAYIDLNYLITKNFTTAKILKFNVYNDHSQSYLTISYFNSYLNKEITCDANLNTHDDVKIKEKDEKYIDIYYAKGYPLKVYLIGYSDPNWGIFVFDLVMVLFMLILIYPNRTVAKNGSIQHNNDK